MTRFQPGEAFASLQDGQDPLAGFRDRFHHPVRDDGTPWIYLVGNSLGLMPREARRIVDEELDDWARLGVEGHFHARRPWLPYHEQFREPLARLVGARPDEVVAMNSLTVNLHLMLASFYRPVGRRRKVLMESWEFPSDTYAVRSHLAGRGVDPDADLLVAHPRPGSTMLETGAIEALLEQQGEEIALICMSAVNYYTGQLLDLERITAAAHRHGCLAGFDLAHAAGNVPLRLHEWGVDFAVWCSYKYLNAGPGAVAGAFVHERHGNAADTPRLAGWWGNDPATRFRMHLNETFTPRPGADGWQLSNPPVLALAPLVASLAIFDEAEIPRLRDKSHRLTGYLEYLIDRIPGSPFEIITPRDPDARGCQLSLRVKRGGRTLFDRLQAGGVLGDFREPDVIRLAPVPLYNSFTDVWRAGQVLEAVSPLP